jgi:protein-S-isoprenylcysteine O-methyltransferase Ste14
MLGSLLLPRLFSLPSPLQKQARAIGIPLMISGVLLGGSAFVAQRRAGTTPNPTHPTAALVQNGPYRYTRNPMYLGMAAIYAGLAILLNEVWNLLLLPVMVLALDRGMVRREEAYLERRFGWKYRRYKKQVRRWI